MSQTQAGDPWGELADIVYFGFEPSRQEIVIAANRAGAELLPDNGQWTNRLQIKSESSTRLYIVAQHKTNGGWGCSCMGWKRHRHCKHLDAMKPIFLGRS